jgi:hypothetical protein
VFPLVCVALLPVDYATFPVRHLKPAFICRS